MQKYDFVLDIETSDPDDAFALCLLTTHPQVNLQAVTVTPGTTDQVGLVKHILKLLGRPDIPVGAGTPKKPDVKHVSDFHYRWLGPIEPAEPDASAVEILNKFAHRHSHIVTGGPLTNLYEAYQSWLRDLKTGKLGFVRWPVFYGAWTCQGGFVGDNLVPEHLILDKFKGRKTCPTFNLNGNPEAAQFLLNPDWGGCPAIDSRFLVPKNVCHGVFYTQEVHARIPDGAHSGLDLLKSGMTEYFKRKPEGKALHDVIAAVAACNKEQGWDLD